MSQVELSEEEKIVELENELNEDLQTLKEEDFKYYGAEAIEKYNLEIKDVIFFYKLSMENIYNDMFNYLLENKEGFYSKPNLITYLYKKAVKYLSK